MVAIASIAVVSMTSCGSSSANTPKEKEISEVKSDIPTWEYEFKEDKMGESTKLAKVYAKDKLNFDFPYNGGSTALFEIRNNNDGLNVILFVSKGQFNTSIIDNMSIRIKFDDEKPKTYTTTSANDGSSNYIFINNEKSLVEKIKKSKKMVVEAEFYNEGTRQIEFNTENLKW